MDVDMDVDVVIDVDVDMDVDSLCCIGQTAEQIATKFGTMTLQVVTSSSSESQSVAWLHAFYPAWLKAF